MARVRISTTVDAERLDTVRRMMDAPDSRILDRALKALVDQLEETQELASLAAMPYEDDPELALPSVPQCDLPYDGEVPAEVLRLAADRRRRLRT